jgi:hypothetical protein
MCYIDYDCKLNIYEYYLYVNCHKIFRLDETCQNEGRDINNGIFKEMQYEIITNPKSINKFL